MNADRIEQLHEKASERYLNGDYPAAIAAWRELLTLDPGNEQALEGVRLSAQLAGEDAAGAPPAAPDGVLLDPNSAPAGGLARGADDFSLESEIEAGLSVLNALPSPGKAGAVAAPDPSRQAGGIDFGAIGDLAAIPLARDAGRESGAGAAEASSDGPVWDLGEEPSGLGALDDLGNSSPAGESGPASVAEEALRRRVLDLLDEARALRDQGQTETALNVIARIYILDETNAAAQELEAELRAPIADDSRAVEEWIVEGVQAFDQGRLDEAKGLFEKVVERIPGHREAVHYLETIAARGRGGEGVSEDLLASHDLLGDIPLAVPDPVDAHAPLTEMFGPVPGDASSRPARPRPAAPSEEAPQRRGLSLPRWAIPAAIGVVVVVLGVVLVPRWLGGDAPPSDPAAGESASRRPAGGAKGARAAASVSPSATVPGAGAASPAQALEKGRGALGRGDYAAAVLAFNEALSVDPTNAEALAGIQQAGDLYKAARAEQEQLDRVKEAFGSGEFASALRVLYRLPETYDKATVNRWKVHGWFNLGVVALRAGETPQAVLHFDEALAILPDPEVSRWRSFAQQYRNRPKDRTFYAAAEAIPFRTID